MTLVATRRARPATALLRSPARTRGRAEPRAGPAPRQDSRTRSAVVLGDGLAADVAVGACAIVGSVVQVVRVGPEAVGGKDSAAQVGPRLVVLQRGRPADQDAVTGVGGRDVLVEEIVAANHVDAGAAVSLDVVVVNEVAGAVDVDAHIEVLPSDVGEDAVDVTPDAESRPVSGRGDVVDHQVVARAVSSHARRASLDGAVLHGDHAGGDDDPLRARSPAAAADGAPAQVQGDVASADDPEGERARAHGADDGVRTSQGPAELQGIAATAGGPRIAV